MTMAKSLRHTRYALPAKASGYTLIAMGAMVGFSVLLFSDVHAANGASILGVILMFTGLGVVMNKR